MGDILLKLVDLTKELNGPHLIMDTILLSGEQLLEKLEAIKVSWVLTIKIVTMNSAYKVLLKRYYLNMLII
jgi:hypothetical protein